VTVVAQGAKEFFGGDAKLLSGAKGTATYCAAFGTADLKAPFVLLREEGASVVAKGTRSSLAPLNSANYAGSFVLVRH
jgi:hypothetical protein